MPSELGCPILVITASNHEYGHSLRVSNQSRSGIHARLLLDQSNNHADRARPSTIEPSIRFCPRVTPRMLITLSVSSLAWWIGPKLVLSGDVSIRVINPCLQVLKSWAKVRHMLVHRESSVCSFAESGWPAKGHPVRVPFHSMMAHLLSSRQYPVPRGFLREWGSAI